MNTTNQEQSQLTADEAKASLGIATNLQNQLLEYNHPQEAPQTQESAPQEAETPKEEKAPTEEKDPMKEMELMFTTKLDEIRQELKKDNQREIDQLKETITSALAEEDTNEPNEA